jgi:ABC-type nitrate/sulfonate/bicarbonate transport system substrate-binding protein
MSDMKMSRRLLLATAAAGLVFGAAPASAQTLEKVTYLFPAPPILPAFGPIQLAKGKGYFKEAGLDVEFGPSAAAAWTWPSRSAPATRRSAASWPTVRSWCAAMAYR